MTNNDIELVKGAIRNIPDFPKPGIQFKDISTLVSNPDVFETTIYRLDEDTVRIFYGASDEVICSAEFSIKEILDTLCK